MTPAPISSPEVAVESAVLHGLGDVRLGDLLSSRQVGDCPADLENPVVGARRQAPPGDRAFEQRLRPRAQLAMFSYQSRRHLRVAINRLAREALLLKPAGATDPFANFGGAFGRLPG